MRSIVTRFSTLPKLLALPKPAPRLRHDEAGVSLLELAFVLPVAFVLIAGLVDFGYKVNNVKLAAAAARHGVRIAGSFSRTSPGALCQPNAAVSQVCEQVLTSGPIPGPTTIKGVAMNAACEFVRESRLNESQWQVTADTWQRIEDGEAFEFVGVRLRQVARNCIFCYDGLLSGYIANNASTFMLEGECPDA